MAVFIDFWPCLFTTKLSYAQLFKWGHSTDTYCKRQKEGSVKHQDKCVCVYSKVSIKRPVLLKFGFSEKATKFEKKSSSYFWQERRVLCAQQRTCQKVDEDFFFKCGQVILYKLYNYGPLLLLHTLAPLPPPPNWVVPLIVGAHSQNLKKWLHRTYSEVRGG